MTKYIIIFTLLISASALSAAEPVRIQDGKFMTIKGGHLSYEDRRVRFWGVNFCAGVKREGKDLDLCFDRLVDLGVNGVRINLFGRIFSTGDPEDKVTYKVPETVVGSNSHMDKLDRSVYLAKQRNMFFWMSFENDDFKPGDYDLLPDDGTREVWNQAIENNCKPEFLVFVYPRAAQVFMQFAKNLLDHVNPYTQRRWADEETIALWEVFNENLFVRDFAFGDLWNRLPDALQADLTRQWNDWLTKRYKDDAGLKRAWGELPPGESLVKKNVAYAPLYTKAKKVDGAGYQPSFEYGDEGKTIAKYPYRRGEDVVRFACFLYRDFHRRFEKFVRKLGKGIAVVPITPTGSFERCFAQYHAADCGDFFSTGVYGFAFRSWAMDGTEPYYPYQPRVNGHPLMGQPVDIMYPAGKPYLLYECNDYRPNPYGVSFPLRIATMLIHQNADGAFWFNWDDAGYLGNLKTDEDYANTRLPMPDLNYPNASLILANDEAFLSAVKGAGAMFLDARLPAARKPKTVVIGKDLLFNLSQPVMGDLEWRLRRAAWRKGIRLKFDPSRFSKFPPDVEEGNKIRQGPYTIFDWANHRGSITVDAPT
ncbi:MAG: hypothetical protein JXA11_17255, partial [Phycisphaerae bacterium]|nr:hypothetical protein [Phycisphaerae bacterium]